jgi:lysophospholipase L1-like esterase
VLGVLLAGVLIGEAKLARRSVGIPNGSPPDGDGVWGHGPGEPISMAVLGDSSAAGLGVQHAIETPAVLLASGLSEVAGRPVRLTNVAVVGATSAGLLAQVDRVLPARPELAVILVGANDVKARIGPVESVRDLTIAVRRLRAAGAAVVVGTCPDLGTIRPLAQPLRSLARRWSRQLAAAQTVAVVEAGGRTVSFGDILGPEFAARPAELFSVDRFHPSAEGYAAAAAVLLPTACVALRVWPEQQDDPAARPYRRERVRPLERVAAQAAGQAGTEVSPAQVRGQDRGPRGRWALLRRRRPRPVAGPRKPAPEQVPSWLTPPPANADPA